MELLSEISLSMKEQESGSLEMQQAMERLQEITRNVSEITRLQAEQRGSLYDSMNHLTGAANDIQSRMDSIIGLMTEFEAFISLPCLSASSSPPPG